MYAMPWTFDKDIATQSMDPRTREFLYIDDPDEGYDVYITREGQGARTKYTVRIARNPTSVDLDDTIIDLLEKNPLPECLQFHDYEHIANAFSGKKVKKAPEAEESEPPKAAKKPEPKRESKPEPKQEEPEVELPTYAEVMEMDEDALFELIETLSLEVDTTTMESAEELQEAIINELGLEKPAPKATARKTFGKPKEPEKAEEPEAEDSGVRAQMQNKLAGLRNRNK